MVVSECRLPVLVNHRQVEWGPTSSMVVSECRLPVLVNHRQTPLQYVPHLRHPFSMFLTLDTPSTPLQYVAHLRHPFSMFLTLDTPSVCSSP
ncbi:hypothetical protein RRG08_010914 [Elysia crispata]|uniref:Uncharacterized protein n=1 Tax=Elysia crispata TaxID=231223 RepID=A0AAE1A1N5_9GAST|nr:hypothetical protein RRG08_010914 [Elysia crispata]